MGNTLASIPIFYSYWWATYKGKGNTEHEAKVELIRVLLSNNIEVQQWTSSAIRSAEPEKIASYSTVGGGVYINGIGLLEVKYESVGSLYYAILTREDIVRERKKHR